MSLVGYCGIGTASVETRGWREDEGHLSKMMNNRENERAETAEETIERAVRVVIESEGAKGKA